MARPSAIEWKAEQQLRGGLRKDAPVQKLTYCRAMRIPPAIVALTSCAMAFALSPAKAAPVQLSSPDGRAGITVSLLASGESTWSVSWRGKTVLQPATIGLRFAGGPKPSWVLRGVARTSHDGMVTGLIGKTSSARDHYNEATLHLAGNGRSMDLILRAYDDGVAYRWRFDTPGDFAIEDEDAGFGVPARATSWVTTADGFGSSYENYYRTGPLTEAAPDKTLLTLPVLVYQGGAWAGITEAALHDWAGLYLVRHDDAPGLGSRLSPRLDRPGVAVIGGAGVHVSPWRLVMLGDAPGRLIESNLVTLLNPPPDKRDWSWVKPGKTSFPWWNDYVWPNAGFTPGLNTATMDAYIDFDADHGIPFHTLDGYQDKAWYGGPIAPDGPPQDLTHPQSEIDLPAMFAHARQRGVGIRFWCHWLPLHARLDATLATWARWGVRGIMVDFMNRDDQEMVAFYDDIARKTADHHMTVVFHGAFKPTGENRTWPNLLTREAIRGTEYDKFSDNPGSTASHEATTPFTRMLAGPMDIHEGGFDAVSPEAFRNTYTAPKVIGTRARALATYVVVEDALSMVADTPVRYQKAVGFDFLTRIPESWDETRVLAGEAGKFVVIARRKGTNWWIGAITDEHARTLRVSLKPLGDRRWMLDGFADTNDRNVAIPKHFRVGAGKDIVIRLTTAGGFAARLSPM